MIPLLVISVPSCLKINTFSPFWFTNTKSVLSRPTLSPSVKVKITLSTHEVNGLSENDFIVASKIDELI